MPAGHGFLAVLACLAGAGLLAVNIWGSGRTLYDPQVQARSSWGDDHGLTFEETLAAIDAVDRSRSGDTEHAVGLMDAVQRRLVHYDGPALRIHPADNWLIAALGLLSPGFARYEFVDPERALRRGLGLCGQQALVLVGLLEQRGFTAGRMRLRGHMTAWTYADGKEIMLDPDYGIVLPFAIEHAQAHLDEVRRLYDETSVAQFPDVEAKTRNLDRIVAVYAVDNKRSGPGLSASAGGGALAIEHGLYALKWLIPVLLLAVGAWLARRAPFAEADDRDGALDSPRAEGVPAHAEQGRGE